MGFNIRAPANRSPRQHRGGLVVSARDNAMVFQFRALLQTGGHENLTAKV
jgi:hypothetical protein